MHIVVCIKQTPTPAEARFDEATKTLVREGVKVGISSLDRRALQEGLRLRDELGGSVTVLTMGPPQARVALQETLIMGADKAIHLVDPLFAGADTLATARTITMAMERLRPDLILCGKFTVDSETGQVPSEVAELLGLAQVTSARKIRSTENPNVLWVERETDDGYQQYEIPLPALISVVELITKSWRPTPEEIEAGKGLPVEEWTAADLQADPALLGATGSPTWVAELRSAQLERKGTVISGEDPVAAAQQLTNYLLERGLFESPVARDGSPRRRPSPKESDPTQAIWVVAELVEGSLRPVTFELLGKAQELANRLGGEVAAVLLGGPEVAAHTPALGAHGADTVYVASDPRLGVYDTELYTSILASAISHHQPSVVLLPSTTDGRDLAPRVAARLQVGLTGDCVGLELDAHGELAQLKPAFGGNIVAPIYSRTRPAMATVRPGMLEACEPDWDVQPRTVSLELPGDLKPRLKLLKSMVEPGLGATRLDAAQVVVGVGLGVGGPENLPMVRDLADALDAALAATLKVVTEEWLPTQMQIGLTGKAVAPRFYIAVGVSGQPNHLMGSRKAEHIIAINSDADAPIFKSADFGVVGDWAEVVPALTRAVLATRERVPAC